ncbi:synaptotagmin-6 isoform X1 [Paramuricea clavata]|uniref:Synaptotagmin-6 isoform X1 n=1 Tax=Paramuricea clavata TaxID=317549 RepID=A0A6S7J0N7_PARCT|nr:synaptotagmin-6 isoform X1 [Paramuricea clavata]
MFVDSVIIVALIVGCLVFFLLVAIFAALFQRELGTKHREKLEEGDISEKQRLTPMPDEAQVEYTTETVQPDSKTPVDGYPHVQEEDSEEFMTDPDVTSTLSILLRYDRQRNYLLVKLLSMFDLPTRNDKTQVNSFLEVRLLPNFGQNPIQTDVYSNTSSPKLEETFEFEVDREELAQQKIEIVVMDAREYSNR